jgi:gamma-glutamyltranspeptidase/glutathione hydrolase
VPGEVRAWQLLHAEHGRLPWAKLFEPAISIARNGFKVPNQLAIAIAQYTSGANAFICTSDIWKDRYCPNGGACAPSPPPPPARDHKA